jgi:hypothetical protein
MSGLPSTHPSTYFGGAGISAELPSGAPASTQRTMVSTSSSFNRVSFEKCPTAGSANHGGITRAATACLIDFAHGLASL